VKLAQPSDLAGPIFEAARALLEKTARGSAYRLIGVSTSDLGEEEQLALFDGATAARERTITAAADTMRRKYGEDAITRARLLEDE
jgi:DNA polymerase-4